ncbi:MAG: PQQ-like beta-propeller repeat protein [Planctomycetes bacterium]|nr:PQQ-like beta-propeller repeat protein [Planctomycetota bacterium]
MNIRILSAMSFFLIGSIALADDWTQFRGPDRLGVSKEKGLLKAWPKGGPQLAWTFKNAGLGFSSMVVSQGTVYTSGTDMDFKDEYVIALNENDGTEKWRTKIAPVFTFKDNSWGDGPRGTPAVDGNLVFALGGQGELICVDTTGKEKWRKNLIADFGGEMMSKWGYSESPLVDGDLVICTPGGNRGTLLALDKKTGAEKWRTKKWTNTAPFSSPVVADIHGKRQYIQVGYVNEFEGAVIAGVNAKDGTVLWKHAITSGGAYSVSPTPIVKGNKVYVSTEDSCQLFEIDAKNSVEKKLDGKEAKVLKNSYGGIALVGNVLYGHSRPGIWIAQDMATGKATKWLERNKLKGNSGALIAADGMIYMFSDDGEVGLAEANPAEFNLVSKFKIVTSQIPNNHATSKDSQTWAHPAIANGRLYLRDHELIYAYEIK